MLKDLDPILHSQLRLGVMSILMNVEEADFTFLKESTHSTSGNLSVQLDKLAAIGYISIQKSFQGKKPCTRCKVTDLGKEAFAQYVENLKNYINL